jgi:hypothetical protein
LEKNKSMDMCSVCMENRVKNEKVEEREEKGEKKNETMCPKMKRRKRKPVEKLSKEEKE